MVSCCEEDCRSVSSEFYFAMPDRRDERRRRLRREWNGTSDNAMKYFYEGHFDVSR